MYAANSEGGGDFYTLTVNSSGVVLDQDYPEVFWNGGRIHYNNADGLIYADDGWHVIDPSTGLPVGIFEVGGGWPMVPDSTGSTVFILAQYIWQENSNFTINLFDMTHYVRLAAVPFPATALIGFNPPRRFIRWGSNGLAVNFKGDNVYLLSGPFINGKFARRSKKETKAVRTLATHKTQVDHIS